MEKLALEVKNEEGFHIKPLTNLSKKLKGIDVDVVIKANGKESNIKSILGVLALGIKKGDQVEFKISGKEEQKAKDIIVEMEKEGFEN
ncbi:HPr family phosphocarrier protein [Geotoga petraea]|jgi:phosphotransferase system HPr (HPr) family protein|uniref:HPr family phosphocarrier protein n=1 Tax=Geotoga petraea TaxID=28234 RepID=A0A4Z0W0R6_9BACT|nr:HPr family phosphocarrier protein [Geotoga petraea]TGG88663.1 HPr family phosphocarrier protein [Geotoga petraea]